jgi:hypothetical protein
MGQRFVKSFKFLLQLNAEMQVSPPDRYTTA